jgi:Tfp pilus assembly protein PilO
MKPGAKESSGSNAAVHAVGGAVCLVIIAAAVYAFVTPIVRARHEAGLQLARLSAVTAELDQAAGVNRGLEGQLVRVRTSVEERMVPLTPAQELNRRLAELTTICLDHGLIPEAIQPRETVRGPVTLIQPIRFEVSGPIGSVYELLGKFDREHPDLHAESLTIEHTGPGTVRMRTVLLWLTAPPR